MAYVPSAGLWGGRVIFVEVVRSLGLLLVTFVFSVVGCCAFWRFGVASLLFIAGASCLW